MWTQMGAVVIVDDLKEYNIFLRAFALYALNAYNINAWSRGK